MPTVVRDGWIMLAANYPEKALEWIALKRADLTDPDYRQDYLAYDQAYDWDPADPRLERLADSMAARFVQLHRHPAVADPEVAQLRQVVRYLGREEGAARRR
ncbi:hypothetical protein LN042_30430 [Kitasatospora sp. RB6PN24]|uniref:hypothetical protein n=1 Tax=Kitasatospora humi TaxID=2893891 RepID=UPI001E458EC3|nr:hypothetical protein [Kitasatospora humi]MCC9311329.1 hypothetical protein [Kitasatospora humi]